MELAKQLNLIKQSLDIEKSSEVITVLDRAIEAVEENEKLKDKTSKALKALVQETEQKLSLRDERQELVEVLCELITMTRKEVYSASSYGAFDRAVKIARKHITQPVIERAV